MVFFSLAPCVFLLFFFFSSRRRHTRLVSDWSSDVCSSDLAFFVTIDREWKNGDRVDVSLPMRLHTESMPDNPKMFAIMYGPMVLVGDLGTERSEERRVGKECRSRWSA